ncbi:hypothetical protein [Streptomyces kaempferi]|uniref:Polymerase/histidinol phosphatase N-terminal domain-containing protein n=1 Tax=Streptomyces kaempferi TaxID=333725 RepID=A0ABW3XU68_9ACTN
MTEQRLPAWADPSVSPARLDPQGVSRRQLLRRAGLFGATLAAGPLAAPAAARGHGLGGDDPRLAYLVGDHHVHSVYSHDAKYTFSQLARAGARYGLDWMVFNEHSNRNFDNTGRLPDPVDTDTPQPGGDFWPGQFSRTHVGVTRYDHRAVMAGLRAGRVWLDHGHLLDGLDVRLKRDRDHGHGVTTGGRLRARAGEKLTLTVTVTTASRPNPHDILPKLAHVDVIRGAVRGPAADRDDWRAPDTRVVRTLDVDGRKGTYTLRVPLVAGDESCYVRLRGSDGNRHGAGYLGASVDPHGPVPHVPGDGDPWVDTWFYTNPVFVDVVGGR